MQVLLIYLGLGLEAGRREGQLIPVCKRHILHAVLLGLVPVHQNNDAVELGKGLAAFLEVRLRDLGLSLSWG